MFPIREALELLCHSPETVFDRRLSPVLSDIFPNLYIQTYSGYSRRVSEF